MSILRSPIGRRLVLMLVGVGLAATAAIGWLGHAYGERALTHEVYRHLISLRSARANQIEGELANTRRVLAAIAASPVARRAIHEFKVAVTELETRLARDGLPPNTPTNRLRPDYEALLAKLRINVVPPPTLAELWPNDDVALYLQSHYLVRNPSEPVDDSAYRRVYETFQPVYTEFPRQFGYADFILVDDRTGRVLFTITNELEFGTSLLTGPYRNSNLAAAFNAVRESPPGTTRVVDFAPYLPAAGAPTAFVAAPVFEGAERIGVVVIQLRVARLEQVMTGGNHWRADGLGDTGEAYLVGPDQLMRSNSRFLLEDPDDYLRQLAARGVPADVRDRIHRLNTTILLQRVDSAAATAALAGQTGTAIQPDYRGVPTLVAYGPLTLGDVNWGLVAKMDEAEAFAPVRAFSRRVIVTAIIGSLSVLGLAILLTRSFLRPIKALMAGAQRVAGGDYRVEVKAPRADEFGTLATTFNRMVSNIREQDTTIRRQNAENERLLLSILPPAIAERLKRGEASIADACEHATVLFADLAGFTQWSATRPAAEVVQRLNSLFVRFDRLAEAHEVEKIKTIGDAYMAVAGILQPEPNHAERIVTLAREMLTAVENFNAEHGLSFQLRLGVNSGPVVAGVIGSTKFIYDLWGDTVNVASRMEATGVAGRIQVTATVYEALKDRVAFEPRGEIEVKGKGRMLAYLVARDG